MEIETESYLSTRERSSDPATDRALKAEAMAADAIRLMVASMSVTYGVLALVEDRNRAFVADLRHEVDLMRERMKNLAEAMAAEGGGRG